MKLETENGTKITNPSIEQINDILSSLSLKNNSYAILSKSKKEYVQTALTKNSRFVLEFQENSIKNHYQSQNKNLTIDVVLKIFYSYSQNSSNWKNDIIWKTLQTHSGKTIMKILSRIFFIISILLFSSFAVLWKFYNINMFEYFGMKWYNGFAIIFSLFSIGSINDFYNWEQLDVHAKSITIGSIFLAIFFIFISFLSLMGVGNL